MLLHHSSLYDYYTYPSKCCVIVDPSCHDHAVQLIGSLGAQIVSVHWLLGDYLGDTSVRDECVRRKVHQWVSDVSHLSQLAVPQPQAVFAALTRCFQGEWVYLQPGCPVYYPTRDLLRKLYLLKAGSHNLHYHINDLNMENNLSPMVT